MEAVLEVPDDAVTQLEPVTFEDGIEDGIEGDDLAVFNVVAHLPAERAVGMEQANALSYHSLLAPEIALQGLALLVELADVVGRRGHYEPSSRRPAVGA